jgi:hypothetical protein
MRAASHRGSPHETRATGRLDDRCNSSLHNSIRRMRVAKARGNSAFGIITKEHSVKNPSTSETDTSTRRCSRLTGLVLGTCLIVFGLQGCMSAAGSEQQVEMRGVAGSPGSYSLALTPLQDPGHQLHQRCIADPGEQGSCAEALICSAFNTPEPYCWHTIGNCVDREVPALGTLCATPCIPGTLPRAAGGCPAGLVCDDSGTWCVPRSF